MCVCRIDFLSISTVTSNQMIREPTITDGNESAAKCTIIKLDLFRLYLFNVGFRSAPLDFSNRPIDMIPKLLSSNTISVFKSNQILLLFNDIKYY